jgi:hypothetical protein
MATGYEVVHDTVPVVAFPAAAPAPVQIDAPMGKRVIMVRASTPWTYIVDGNEEWTGVLAQGVRWYPGVDPDPGVSSFDVYVYCIDE